MPATNQDIEHWKGDDAQIRITVLDQDDNPVDLTDATARWWMTSRLSPASTGAASIYIQKSTADGGIIITENSGTFTLTIELQPEDTENLTPGKYYHETEVVDSAGEISTVTVGKFILRPTAIPDVL